MTNPLDAVLSQALAIRLNLQISLASLPVVEEWMDIHLTRWLESIPLPPEMPMGHSAHFGVTVSPDLGRLSWRAYGNPDGFVPKLVPYLDACRMSRDDAGLLDEMGSRLEPKLVGSWITVSADKVVTGWQFCDEHPFAAIEPLFADHHAKSEIVGWLESTGVSTFHRFAQAIGDDVFSEIELPVPGMSVDDQVAHASRGFVALTGVPMPEHAVGALSTAAVPGMSLAVRIRQGRIVRVGAIASGLGNDVIAELCKGARARFDNHLMGVQGALGVDAADRVEYGHELGKEPTIDVHLIPTGDMPPLRSREAN